MSAPVDVLAVRAAEILAETNGDGQKLDRGLLAIRIAQLEQRDAAAAELIDANRALLASAPPHMTHRNAKEREAYRYIRAALANVGGAP